MKRRGNILALEADAADVVRRYLDGIATIKSLMREYRVAYGTLNRFLRAHTTAGQLAASRHRNNQRAAREAGFKKGHATWNKGKKGIHLSPATEFQPGCLRGQAARLYRHVGSVVIRRDNRRRRYRWIKARDDGPPPHVAAAVDAGPGERRKSARRQNGKTRPEQRRRAEPKRVPAGRGE